MLSGPQAYDAGFADILLEPVEFLDQSLALLLEKIEEGGGKRRPDHDLSDAAEVCRKARARLEDQVHGGAPAPYRALDLIEGAATWSLEDGYRAEEDALAELLPGPQAQASLYAFDLVERRAKRGVGIPEVAPRPVAKVGLVGAGLMARQLALLVLRRLEVPVVLRDLDGRAGGGGARTGSATSSTSSSAAAASGRRRRASSARSSREEPSGRSSTAAISCSRRSSRSSMSRRGRSPRSSGWSHPSACSRRTRRHSRSRRWPPISSIRSVSSACTSSTPWPCSRWSSSCGHRRPTT